MNAPVPVKTSFKQRMLLAREEAIVDTVSCLLAEKGFDAMTVDEVAARVGIAKASLYKHFACKDDLAASAMARVLCRAQALMDALPPDAPPLAQLRAVVQWMLQVKLAGGMPQLPGPLSPLRMVLLAHPDYAQGAQAIRARLMGWIEAAQASGALNPLLPSDVLLYTLYARAGDPVLDLLQRDGRYTEAEIIDWVMCTCFEGLNAR